MSNVRCSKCSLVNFASSDVCKRCGEPLGSASSNELYPQPDDHFGSHAAQAGDGSMQEADSYAAQYRPGYGVAKPRARKGKGVGATLFALLCLVALVGIPLYLKGRGPNEFANYSWREFKADDGSFSILMPKEPKQTRASMGGPRGSAQMTMYHVETEGKTAYGVGTIEFPPEANIPVDQVFEKAIQSVVQNTGAVVLNRKNITLDGHPGVELEFKPPPSANKDGDKGVVRLYWASPRIFMVMVGGPDSSEATSARAKYLDSFKITSWR